MAGMKFAATVSCRLIASHQGYVRVVRCCARVIELSTFHMEQTTFLMCFQSVWA